MSWIEEILIKLDWKIKCLTKNPRYLLQINQKKRKRGKFTPRYFHFPLVQLLPEDPMRLYPFYPLNSFLLQEELDGESFNSHLITSMPSVLLISFTTGLSKLTGPTIYGDFTPVIIVITCNFPLNSGIILAPQ